MKNEGFSLLEALLAATILFVGITVVMTSLTSSITMNTVTEEQNMAITAIANQVEQIKSMDFTELETFFGGAGTVVEGATLNFAVPGLKAPDGSDNTAFGIITVHEVMDPDLGTPILMEDLVEVHIRIEYKSGLETQKTEASAYAANDFDVEEVTVWISPKY